MPSITRPNAPNRLPSSDFGDLFLKPPAPLISSAVGTPSSPRTTYVNPFAHRRIFHSSEGGEPTPSSPLAFPSTYAAARRPALQDLREYRSDSSVATDFAQATLKDFYPVTQYTIKEDEPTILNHRQSSTSSLKALNLLGYSGASLPRSPPLDEPPREPHSGFKWKQDFLGGWLEIRVGRPKEADGTPRGSAGVSPSGLSSLISASPDHRALSQTITITDSAPHSSTEPLISETPSSLDKVSIVGPLQEGLYCRTKRALGLKHGPIGVSPYAGPRVIYSRAPTDAILDRVGSVLKILPSRDSFASSASTSTSNLSIASPHKRRQRGAWYSNSSSVRNLLMARPMPSTPEPEAMYTGSDSNQYMVVDLTEVNAPTFLPSEARRVHTPPLPSPSHNGKGHSRGFFFDYNTPLERRPSEDILKSSSASPESPPQERDWFRTKLDLFDDPAPKATKELMEAEVPEHFPSSPLCPRNPKHKSGGTGTCPYHGRNKSTPSEPEDTPKKGLSPAPETWWMK